MAVTLPESQGVSCHESPSQRPLFRFCLSNKPKNQSDMFTLLTARDRPTTEVPFSSFSSSSLQNIGVPNSDGNIAGQGQIEINKRRQQTKRISQVTHTYIRPTSTPCLGLLPTSCTRSDQPNRHGGRVASMSTHQVFPVVLTSVLIALGLWES